MAPRRSRRVPAAVLRPRHRPAAAEERGMEEPRGRRTSSGGGNAGARAQFGNSETRRDPDIFPGLETHAEFLHGLHFPCVWKPIERGSSTRPLRFPRSRSSPILGSGRLFPEATQSAAPHLARLLAPSLRISPSAVTSATTSAACPRRLGCDGLHPTLCRACACANWKGGLRQGAIAIVKAAPMAAICRIWQKQHMIREK
ncbi:uncharacterized protein LOC120689057 [Panicum virgatum]|uniref:uncharacterized protein LOC120689057 n=1 Tax=Panicum virgatum TaxID=38727 RepID=UPI0019D5A874|nr:uncharacterized protein LOC120689057 [Panicum virgatum]